MIHNPLTGQLRKFGKVHRTREEVFFDATVLPSWLEAPVGTYSFSAPTAGTGRGTVATGTVSGDMASIRAKQAFDSSQFVAAAVTVECLTASTDGAFDWGLSLDTSDTLGNGVALRHMNNNANAQFRAGNPAGDGFYPIPYAFKHGGEPFSRRNLTLLWLRREQVVVAMSDDSVIAATDVSAKVTNGLIRPRVWIRTLAASSVSLSVAKFRMDVWNN
jgi:hypothetical protein